jgi:hypothetical protein
MSQIISQALLLAALAASASGLRAEQLIVYPAEGQSAHQQSKDRGECQVWASDSTGIDPARLAATPAPPPGPAVGGGERLGGAARGALGGLAIGAIAGDGGKGAAIGAVVGTMAGGRRARLNRSASQQQAQAQRSEQMSTWNRALGACMEARGYTVR